MDNIHLQFKSFIDSHPDVEHIGITYSDASYFVLSIRCLDKDSVRLKGNSKAVRYEEVSYLSEYGNIELMHILSMMYDECQCLE